VHDEYGESGTPVITLLSCSLDGQQITVDLTPGSRLAELHGERQVRELTTCTYGLAPDFTKLASTHGLSVAASEPDAGVRAIERVDHPFFLGTLYQPQLCSTPGAPHPVFVGLLRAAARRATQLAQGVADQDMASPRTMRARRS
jgi:CTP synthase (UTP-ammonia lyase)